MKNLILLFCVCINIFSNEWQAKTIAIYKDKFHQKKVNIITKMNADIMIQKANGKILKDAKLGDIIDQNDTITQYYGTSEVSLVGNKKVQINGRAKLKINKNTIHWIEGDGNFKLKSSTQIKTSEFDLGMKNANFNLHKNENNTKNFIAKSDFIEVKNGQVLVKAPKNIRSFNISYDTIQKTTKANKFVLKKGQRAEFDGNKVKIFDENKKTSTIERDMKFKLWLGGGMSLIYLDTKYKNSFIQKDTKGLARFGLNAIVMTRKIDPMYMIFWTTDKQMEELGFSYFYPLGEHYEKLLFKSTPYFRLNLGIGNTHSKNFEPTHISAGFGIGALKEIGSFLAFLDLQSNYRKWDFDRSKTTKKQVWTQTEFSIWANFVYRLRW